MKKFLFIIFAACLFLSSCTQKPSYKIPKYDPNQKSKTVISENNINTQVLISFRNDISHSEACCWLKEHDAKILDANEQFNYYLVRTHSEQAAEALISQCETPIIDCAVRNTYLYPCALSMHVIDGFDNPVRGSSLSHGEMVKEIMEEGLDNIYVSAHNVDSIDGISRDKMSSEFLDICKQMNNTDMTIVNFSLGISKYKDEERTTLKSKETFYQDYADDIRWYADLAHKCGNKNFIITKAMGNESMHSIDEAFQLSLEKMNDNQRKTLKEHMIIVAAKDTRKAFPVGYSNRINHKIEGVNTIMVDISDKPKYQSGTSAAAPLVANWIAKSSFTNASDAIEAINESTQSGELVSEDAFNRIAQRNRQSDEKHYDQIASEYDNPHYSNELVGTQWMHINKYGQLSCVLTFVSENKVHIKNFIRYSNSSNAPIHVQEIDNAYTYDQSNKRGIKYSTNGDLMHFVFSNNSLIFTGEYNDGRPARLVFVPYSEKRKGEEITIPAGYVDLGLHSGTLWKDKNEEGGFYIYDQAMSKFGNELPTKEQFEELKSSCKWAWTGSGYKVTGPSGASIYLPAEGWGMPASEI
ncbi:MAG: hypothetical protein MJZ90_08025 [Bacteroidales bacterium]|nr:hypothetical protein [Bacteroidales bacterium]